MDGGGKGFQQQQQQQRRRQLEPDNKNGSKQKLLPSPTEKDSSSLPTLSIMSEDAHGGPEIFSDDDSSNGPYSIYATRPPMNQEEFDARFGYSKPIHHHPTLIRKAAKFSRRYYKPFTSMSAFFQTIIGFIPILEWLPKYNYKENGCADIIGGLTVGIMHVPQGIAYALLANVKPVVGLYTSFFPPLFYMIFGTSRHNSIGSFAVVALMSGLAVSKSCGIDLSATPSSMNESIEVEQRAYEACALGTASTLAFCVGIIHLVMAVLRLEIITTYFSDQLVAGFTTAASFHVFVTQLKDLFGLRGVSKAEGPGHLFRTLWTYLSNYDKMNPLTCLMGFSAIAFLIIGKDYVNPYLKKRFRLATPLPFELMVVVFATIISAVFNLNPNFNVKIVQTIPTGLPTPHVPRLSELPDLFVDGLSIAVVVVAVHISLAKMFAKKLRYKVDPGQELYALGLSSSLSAFFPVYPVSCSLGRTLVNVEAGTKTQLSTIASTVFLAAIIGYIGQWLETLPMCVLSAIVIVALKGMIKKFADLPKLWPVSKIDCSIWIVSFVATVAWDVTPGLGVSIIWALMTTVFRTQFPRWHFLATLQGTNDFRDSERYKAVVDHNGICIFRFDSPLLFTNVDKFKTSIEHAVYKWETEKPALTPQSILPEELKISPDEAEELASNVLTVRSASDFINPDKPFASLLYRHFVIDCSGFTFVDYMGVNALKEVFTEMRNKKVLVYFAAAKAPVRDLFEACGFYQYVAKHNFYPTIRDAVAIARKRRNASTMHLLDEIRLHHDVLHDMIRSQPMD